MMRKNPMMRRNIIAAYKSGLTLRQVAAKFGLTMQRIHQIVAEDAPYLMRRPHARYSAAQR